MSNCNISRNGYLDFIKGIAIILVVLGHNIQYGSSIGIDNGFYENHLFRFIYSFHMPLFMLVSGYLFYFTVNKYTFIENIKSRFTRLVFPIICWTILNYLIRCIISGDFLPFTPVSFLYSIWFLWAIFWCSLAVLLIRRWCNDNIGVYAVLGCALLLIPDLFRSSLYIYMYPYFIVGYMWNRYGAADCTEIWQKSRSSFVLLLTLFILYVILYMNFSQECYIYTSGTFLLKNGSLNYSQLGIDLYRYLIGFVGAAICLLLVNLIYNKVDNKMMLKAKAIIESLGQRSLGIYIISEYFINAFIFQKLPKENLGFMSVCVETLFVLLITSILTNILSKNHYSSKCLLGGK